MSGGHGPRTLEEMHEEEQITAAEKLSEGIKGFYLTDPFNAKIEDIRKHNRDHFLELLNVSKETADKLEVGGKKIHEVIIDARVTEQLKQRIKKHREEHKTYKRFVPFSEEWKKNRRSYAHGVKEMFEHATDVKEMQNKLLESALKDQDQAVLVEIYKKFIGATVPAEQLELFEENPEHVGVEDLMKFFNDSNSFSRLPQIIEDVSNLIQGKGNSDEERRKEKEKRIHALQKYQELQEIVSVEKAKVLSVHIYDPDRLVRTIVKPLKKAAESGGDAKRLWDALSTILGKDFDHKISHDYKLQSLLVDLEAKYQSGGLKNLADLLEEIRTKTIDTFQPQKTEKTESDKEASKKIDDYYQQLRTTTSQLVKKYREAEVLDGNIQDLQTRFRDTAGNKKLQADIAQDITAAEKRKTDLPSEVQDLERQYQDQSSTLVEYLEKDLGKTLGTKLNGIKVSSAQPITTPAQLFSSMPAGTSDLMKALKKLMSDRSYFNEIKSLKTSSDKGNLSADGLLFEIKKHEVEKLGKFHDEAQILKIARMATSFAQIDAKNVELFRAGNRMAAESRLGGVKGVWNKSKQQVASTFFNSDTFRARDIIEHIAGLDHAFEVFKDLPIDASLADIRKAIKHHGGISTENMMKFYLKLQDAVKGFTVGHGRNVKIADRDWSIEQVALFAEKIHAELEAREFCHKIEHPETEEDKKLLKTNKAEFFQKMLNQREDSQKKLETAHLEQLRNPNELWQISFLHSLMKEKYSKAYEEALAEGKKQGWSKKRLMEYLQNEKSVPRTIVKHLMTGLAIKEGWDIFAGAGRWIKSKLFGASEKAAKEGTQKGAGLVGRAWRGLGSGIKKGGGAVGRGIGRGVRGTADFFVGKPLRFFFKESPKLDKQGNVIRGAKWSIFKTPKNIAKAIWWPFGLVGRGTKGFFNFFHYTEEKRKADEARYAAKQAGKGHAGGAGHGGAGGHGGGH